MPPGHGTSQLHTSVRSLRFLHCLVPAAVGGVSRIETFTSVCDLCLDYCMQLHMHRVCVLEMFSAHLVARFIAGCHFVAILYAHAHIHARRIQSLVRAMPPIGHMAIAMPIAMSQSR